MPKQTWIFASVLSVAVVIAFIGFTAWQKGAELEKAQADLNQARAASEQTSAQANALKNDLAEQKTRIEELQREREKATQAQKTLEQEMRSALDSKDITISQLQGKLTVNILDRILFDSGEAVLKSEGEKVLQQISSVLAQYPNRQIHVIGHTDNVPIRVTAKTRFASNWELSTARATAAVRFLCERAGADPRRLGAVGYGEFHPIADNSTGEGRAKNRRIALVVLPEELAATEEKITIASPALAPKPATDLVPASTNATAL